MSKILFGVNVPRSAASFLTHHSVAFADRCGWRERTNGDLIAAAETDGFDVMLSADTNLRYQQNLVARRSAIVVLSTNAWPVIRDNAEQVVRAIDAATPGTYRQVMFALPPSRRRPPPRR